MDVPHGNHKQQFGLTIQGDTLVPVQQLKSALRANVAPQYALAASRATHREYCVVESFILLLFAIEQGTQPSNGIGQR